MVPYVITAIITFVITAVAIWFISAEYHKRVANTKIGNAEEKARGIIDEAVKTAENKKRESMLEIKEETIRSKNELDKESCKESKGLCSDCYSKMCCGSRCRNYNFSCSASE